MIPRSFFLRFTAAAVVALICGAGQAFAGFEWTPPAAQNAPAVAVPDVEAEPLAPADMVPARPAASDPTGETAISPENAPEAQTQQLLNAAPTSAPAPEQPLEPVLKMKKIGQPEQQELPAISKPPAGMAMPENPGIAAGPQPLQSRTISVPPPEEEAKEMTLPPEAPVPQILSEIRETELAPAEAKKGLSINPFPIQDGTSAKKRVAGSPAAKPAPKQPGVYEEVVGFGSDMPLALALRQVVPPQYAYSFAKGVNPGYRVSWNGGAPWNVVVQNMIAPLNLVLEIRGHTLYIKPASDAANGSDLSSFAPMAPAAPPQDAQEAAAPPAALSGAEGDDIGKNDIEAAAGAEEDGVMEAEKNLLMQNKAGTVKLASTAPAATPSEAQGINHARIWEAKQGDSLKDILTRWSQEAKMDLVWNAAHDYELDSGVLVNGTFGSALTVLFMHGLEPGTAPLHRVSEEGGAGSLIIEDPAS